MGEKNAFYSKKHEKKPGLLDVTSSDFCVTIHHSMRNFFASPNMVMPFNLELPDMRKMQNTMQTPNPAPHKNQLIKIIKIHK